MNLSEELKYLGNLLEKKLISNQSVGERLQELAMIEKYYPMIELSNLLSKSISDYTVYPGQYITTGTVNNAGTHYWDGKEWRTLQAMYLGLPLCDCGVFLCKYPYERKIEMLKAYWPSYLDYPNKPVSHVQYKKDLQKRKDDEMVRVESVYKIKKDANDKWYNERYEQIRDMK